MIVAFIIHVVFIAKKVRVHVNDSANLCRFLYANFQNDFELN